MDLKIQLKLGGTRRDVATLELTPPQAGKEGRLHVCGRQVEWDDWEKTKTKFGSGREKVTYTDENCTLKFSGQRVYILRPGRKEIIKARQNVRWTAAEVAPL